MSRLESTMNPNLPKDGCTAGLILRKALVGALPGAVLLAPGVIWIDSSDSYQVRPSPTALETLVEAGNVGHGLLVVQFLAAAALGLGLFLLLRLFSRFRESPVACIVMLPAPSVGLLTAALLLVANVRFLRFRMAPISLVTDAVIVLLGLGLLVVLSRYLARSPRITHWLDSSPLLWAGVSAIDPGSPLYLTGNEASSTGPGVDSASNQEHIASTSSSNSEPTSSTQWNVVLISIDTLRPDRLGIYGYDRPISPRIDQLAANGVVFSRAYSTAPWTLPAQMSMITGLLPSAHGAQLSPVFTTEVERLSQSENNLGRGAEQQWLPHRSIYGWFLSKERSSASSKALTISKQGGSLPISGETRDSGSNRTPGGLSSSFFTPTRFTITNRQRSSMTGGCGQCNPTQPADSATGGS